MYPADLKYSREHEWVRVEGNQGRIGLTQHAQHALGDVVFVELPKPGRKFAVVNGKMETLGVVESVKAVSDVFCPLSGEVVEVNAALETRPELVNQDCYGAGWMIVVTIANPKELDALMDVKAYEAFLASEGAV
jgi:glycine cleavage system H protein